MRIDIDNSILKPTFQTNPKLKPSDRASLDNIKEIDRAEGNQSLTRIGEMGLHKWLQKKALKQSMVSASLDFKEDKNHAPTADNKDEQKRTIVVALGTGFDVSQLLLVKEALSNWCELIVAGEEWIVPSNTAIAIPVDELFHTVCDRKVDALFIPSGLYSAKSKGMQKLIEKLSQFPKNENMVIATCGNAVKALLRTANQNKRVASLVFNRKVAISVDSKNACKLAAKAKAICDCESSFVSDGSLLSTSSEVVPPEMLAELSGSPEFFSTTREALSARWFSPLKLKSSSSRKVGSEPGLATLVQFQLRLIDAPLIAIVVSDGVEDALLASVLAFWATNSPTSKVITLAANSSSVALKTANGVKFLTNRTLEDFSHFSISVESVKYMLVLPSSSSKDRRNSSGEAPLGIEKDKLLDLAMFT